MNNDEHNLTEFDKIEEVEAGYFRKWLFGFVDAVIVICLYLIMVFYLPYEFLHDAIRSVSPALFIVILLIVFRLVTILFFGATPGMAVFKIKFLDGEQNPPGFKEKLLASVFVMANGVRYYEKK